MKITDTIDAKILTILSDWFEHDADRMADAMLEIKELVHQELENIFLEMEKKVSNILFTENGFLREDGNLASDILNELETLKNLKQEYLGKGKDGK